MSRLSATTDPQSSEEQEHKLTVSAGNEAPDQDELSAVLHLVTTGNTKLLFDPEAARKREAERRRKTMGEFALHDLDKQHLRAFALERYVPEKALTKWKQNFLLHGLDGLLPQDWLPLKEQSQQKVIERLKTLGKLTEVVTITEEDMSSLVSRLGGSWRGGLHPSMIQSGFTAYGIRGLLSISQQRHRHRGQRLSGGLP